MVVLNSPSQSFAVFTVIFPLPLISKANSLILKTSSNSLFKKTLNGAVPQSTLKENLPFSLPKTLKEIGCDSIILTSKQ